MTDRVTRWERLLFAAFSALAVIPLWTVEYLPMADLPQQTAQVAIWRDWSDAQLGYGVEYEINWFTPYLLGYCLTYLLTYLMPLKMAVTFTVTCALLAVPLALRRLLGRGGRHRGLMWLAGFPIAFSYAFYWGFLNYLVATPIGILFLAESFEYARDPTKRRAVLLGLLSIALLLSHILVLAFCLFVGGLVVIVRSPGAASAARRLVPMALPVPLMMAWVALVGRGAQRMQGSIEWRVGWGRTLDVAGVTLGGFRGLVPLSILALLVLAPLVAGYRPSRDHRRWVPVVVTLGISLLAPFKAMGTAFLYPRFAVFLLPLYLFALDRSSAERSVWRESLLPTTAVAWLLMVGVALAHFDSRASGFAHVVDAIPSGQRVLYGDLLRTREGIPAPIFMHFGAWYQVERGGFVDYSFAQLFPQLFRYRPERAPAFTEEFPWEPERFEWGKHAGDRYDYFVFRAADDPSAAIFDGAARPPALTFRTGDWWLYASDPDTPPVGRGEN
jgi:hypothetical protein